MALRDQGRARILRGPEIGRGAAGTAPAVPRCRRGSGADQGPGQAAAPGRRRGDRPRATSTGSRPRTWSRAGSARSSTSRRPRTGRYPEPGPARSSRSAGVPLVDVARRRPVRASCTTATTISARRRRGSRSTASWSPTGQPARPRRLASEQLERPARAHRRGAAPTSPRTRSPTSARRGSCSRARSTSPRCGPTSATATR